MAYLVAHLAWPLVLLALAGGAAGWFWHAMRTAAEVDARERARTDIRAALFTLQDEMAPLDGDEAALSDRVRAAERDAADWRRRAAEFEALAAERDERVVELRKAVVEADAWGARVAELEAGATALATEPVDVAPYEARIAALEAELEVARAAPAILAAAEPVATAAPEPVRDPAPEWRTRYLEHRLAWAERQIASARRPGVDPAVVAERDAARAEAALLRTQLAEALAVTPVSAAEDELNVLRWKARYLNGRVRYLEDRALGAAAPIAPVAVAEPDPEEASRTKWRQRYIASRIAYLEQREKELAATAKAAEPDPAAMTALQDEIVRVRTAYTQLHGQAQAAVTAANERQAKIVALESDLAAALDMASEADSLRAKVRDLETAQAVAIDPADMTRMNWKARYNEARVTWLEARLAEVMDAKAAAEARLAQAPAQLPLSAAPAPEPAPQPTAVESPQPAPSQRIVEAVAPAEPRYVWRRVRVLDDPTPSPRERVVWRRASPQEPAPGARTAAAPAPMPAPVAPRPPRPAPHALPTIADRPPGLPAPRGGAPDDLRMIAGVGPKIESTLNSLGVYHFDQIAAWTPEQISWVDQYLSFRGRVSRESWIEQARALARGEETDGKRRYLQGEHV